MEQYFIASSGIAYLKFRKARIKTELIWGIHKELFVSIFLRAVAKAIAADSWKLVPIHALTKPCRIVIDLAWYAIFDTLYFEWLVSFNLGVTSYSSMDNAVILQISVDFTFCSTLWSWTRLYSFELTISHKYNSEALASDRSAFTHRVGWIRLFYLPSTPIQFV